MHKAPFHWIHCSRFCVKGALCLSEGRYCCLPPILFLVPDTVFRIEAIELVWEAVESSQHHSGAEMNDKHHISFSAPPHCRTKEPDSSAGVTSSLPCLPSEISIKGWEWLLSLWERSGEALGWAAEERRVDTVNSLRCSAGWRRKRRCLYWSYSRGWTVSSPMLVSGLFSAEADGGVLQLWLIFPSLIQVQSVNSGIYGKPWGFLMDSDRSLILDLCVLF